MEEQIQSRKIGLVGSAGLGKSSIAAKVGDDLGMIFLRSKDITRPIMKKYDYRCDECTCVEKFLSRKDIEFEIVDSRISQEALLTGGFITDRTTLECFAYALLSVDKYADDEIVLLEKICREHMKEYTDIYYFPYSNGWLEDNGIRTVNGFFQWKIDLIIRGLIDDWDINVKPVVVSDPITFIEESIKGNGSSDMQG